MREKKQEMTKVLFQSQTSWIHESYRSHEDASVPPFEDYIWLGDHFYEGGLLFIREIKEMQQLRLACQR